MVTYAPSHMRAIDGDLVARMRSGDGVLVRPNATPVEGIQPFTTYDCATTLKRSAVSA